MAKKVDEAKEPKAKVETKKVEEPKKEDPKNEPIINTEAAKAKAEELANNVKEGATELASNVKEGANNFVEKVKGDRNLLIAVCVCAFVVVVLFFSLICCDGSKGVAKDMSKALVKMDAKKYCKAINKTIVEEVYDDLDSCKDYMEDALEESDEDAQPTKYKIKSDKKLKKDDVEDIAEILEDKYGIDENKVKKVVRYKVHFDAKKNKNDFDLYIFTAKIKGKWSVIGVSPGKEYTTAAFDKE